MSIADKFNRILNNVSLVHNAGYTQGKQDGYIEGEEAGYNNGYREGVEDGKEMGGFNEGYDAGKQAERDAFWSDFTANGTRTYYADAFRGSTVEYVRPKHKITPKDKGGASRIFYGCKFLKKAEAAYIDFSQIPRGSHVSETYYNTFTMCYELEEVEDIGFVPTFSYGSTFNVCKSLKKIAVIRADAGTQFLNDTFGNCIALEEITFEGEIGSDINFKWSTKLTRASIENIINHLSDNVSGKSLTLSKTATENAFPDWNDWGALVMAHQNWEIKLV